MWIQFTRRIYCKIPFIYDPKTRSNVWLLSMIKNTEIYLVQLAARPFMTHINRSLRVLLNLTLHEMSLGVPKPKPYPRYRVLNHVSIISIPKLDFHPHTHNFHTNIHSSLYPYSNSILKFSSSIHPYFHTCDLLFLSFFLLFFSLLLLFFVRFCSLYFQDQNEIFILVLSLFDLIPFLFHFQRRKLPPSFLQATWLLHNFLPYFILISFFYYSLVLQFSITLDLTYAYSYFGI